MDNHPIYNVWQLTESGQWDTVLKITVTEGTATTLAALLAYENNVPRDRVQYVVSVSRPASFSLPTMKQRHAEDTARLQRINRHIMTGLEEMDEDMQSLIDRDRE